MKRNNKGFTLVELMVVVVIIAVLVAIAIPAYNAVTTRAEAGACEANIRMLDGAVVQWQAANDVTTFPTFADLTTAGDYFQEAPTCPSAGVYSIDATGRAQCTVH